MFLLFQFTMFVLNGNLPSANFSCVRWLIFSLATFDLEVAADMGQNINVWWTCKGRPSPSAYSRMLHIHIMVHCICLLVNQWLTGWSKIVLLVLILMQNIFSGQWFNEMSVLVNACVILGYEHCMCQVALYYIWSWCKSHFPCIFLPAKRRKWEFMLDICFSYYKLQLTSLALYICIFTWSEE